MNPPSTPGGLSSRVRAHPPFREYSPLRAYSFPPRNVLPSYLGYEESLLFLFPPALFISLATLHACCPDRARGQGREREKSAAMPCFLHAASYFERLLSADANPDHRSGISAFPSPILTDTRTSFSFSVCRVMQRARSPRTYEP